MNQCAFKVSVVGCGHVGVTAAYAMLLSGIPTELTLVSRELSKAKGEKLDFDHAQPFIGSTKITAADSYQAVEGSRFIVFTAGVAQRPGETRLDLTNRNKQIIEQIVPQLERVAPNAVLLIVSNPVDVLTYHASQISNYKPGQVFGSGTTLDTARFRFHLSEILNVNARSIHAYILGEHGDSAFPAISSASIGGQALLDFPKATRDSIDHAFQLARSAAYQIIKAKGMTNYAIGTVVARIMENVFYDSLTVLPISTVLSDYYGISNIAMSVPCIIGSQGVSQQVKLPLSEAEQAQLHQSANILSEFIK